VGTNLIKTITYDDNGGGLINGLIIGAGVGYILEELSRGPDTKDRFGTVLTCILGAFTGSLVGAMSGETWVFVIN